MNIFVLLVGLASVLNVATGQEFVENVLQNYFDETNDRLIQQIRKELSASYIYQGYASYLQRADVSLPGIKKFFSDASLEEREHAQTLIDYINTRGGQAQLSGIDLKSACKAVLDHAYGDSGGLSNPGEGRMCICGFITATTINSLCGPREAWKDGLMALEDALAIERYVSEELLQLHKETEAIKDVHLTHILEHDFLDEQVSSVNKLAHYVQQLRSFTKRSYKLGEHLFDQKLL